MFDLATRVNLAEAIAPGTYSADTTPAAVDRQGFESMTLELAIGVGGITFSGTNKIEFVWTHSDDGATFTSVADSDLLGVTGVSNGIVKALTAAKAASDVTKIGYVGNKRYHKLLADFSGTHGTGTGIQAAFILGHALINPTA